MASTLHSAGETTLLLFCSVQSYRVVNHRCDKQDKLSHVRSYRDYRSDEDYTLTSQFWLVLAVRFAFVILFEVRTPDVGEALLFI